MIVDRRRATAAAVAVALALSACSGNDEADRQVSAPLSIVTSSTAETSTSGSSSDDARESDTEIPDVIPDPLVGELRIAVIATHPHDPNGFTQGLEVHDGQLLESTGLYGESDRRLVEIGSGEIQRIEPIDADLFGEGLTVVDDEILQLTWKAGVYIRSDLETLAETGRGSYEGQGWGLCFDGTRLVMSDGTPTLTFRDPGSFDRLETIEVTLNGEPLANLNELECVNGQVLANVYRSDSIVVVDPTTGAVVATLNAGSLRPDDAPFEDSRFALNGIAHDPTSGRFYLTGKRWSVLYEVELS